MRKAGGGSVSQLSEPQCVSGILTHSGAQQRPLKLVACSSIDPLHLPQVSVCVPGTCFVSEVGRPWGWRPHLHVVHRPVCAGSAASTFQGRKKSALARVP